MLKLSKNAKENIEQDVKNVDAQLMPGDDKYMYFANDDEFYQYCIDPNPVFNTDEIEKGLSQILSFTYDFTKAYYKAIEDGIKFVIKDPKSVIAKRGCVNHRTINKPVQNLEPYYGEGFYTDSEADAYVE